VYLILPVYILSLYLAVLFRSRFRTMFSDIRYPGINEREYSFIPAEFPKFLVCRRDPKPHVGHVVVRMVAMRKRVFSVRRPSRGHSGWGFESVLVSGYAYLDLLTC
jgi:hypothetical protein